MALVAGAGLVAAAAAGELVPAATLGAWRGEAHPATSSPVQTATTQMKSQLTARNLPKQCIRYFNSPHPAVRFGRRAS